MKYFLISFTLAAGCLTVHVRVPEQRQQIEPSDNPTILQPEMKIVDPTAIDGKFVA